MVIAFGACTLCTIKHCHVLGALRTGCDQTHKNTPNRARTTSQKQNHLLASVSPIKSPDKYVLHDNDDKMMKMQNRTHKICTASRSMEIISVCVFFLNKVEGNCIYCTSTPCHFNGKVNVACVTQIMINYDITSCSSNQLISIHLDQLWQTIRFTQ